MMAARCAAGNPAEATHAASGAIERRPCLREGTRFRTKVARHSEKMNSYTIEIACDFAR
jgi:hypothetical protein